MSICTQMEMGLILVLINKWDGKETFILHVQALLLFYKAEVVNSPITIIMYKWPYLNVYRIDIYIVGKYKIYLYEL